MIASRDRAGARGDERVDQAIELVVGGSVESGAPQPVRDVDLGVRRELQVVAACALVDRPDQRRLAHLSAGLAQQADDVPAILLDGVG